MKYIVPKIFCALGAIAIFAGVFLSEINITLGNMQKSAGIAVLITAVLLLFAILAFKMKDTKKRWCLKKLVKCKSVEIISIILFAFCGLASLLVFNHCIMVWQRTGEIQKNLNIRQLENMLPKYENYANNRIANYQRQLDDAVQYRQSRSSDLTNLGFDIYSIEDLTSQKERKIVKLKQVVYPHTYDTLKISINDSIATFVNIVENFSPITAPKNIITIEEWAKAWEQQLNAFSHYKMKGENTEDFRFVSTFGNVEQILTEWQNFGNPKRFLGYGIGLIALLCMLCPYIFARRSIKITKTN